MLMKEIIQGTKKWKCGKIYHVHRLEDLLLKCPSFPKQFINLMQSLSKFFLNRKKNSTIHIGLQKTTNGQKNPENKEQSWFQYIQQNLSSQHSIVLHKDRHKSQLGQNREPRNKSMHIWSTDLWQGCQEYKMQERIVS